MRSFTTVLKKISFKKRKKMKDDSSFTIVLGVILESLKNTVNGNTFKPVELIVDTYGSTESFLDVEMSST